MTNTNRRQTGDLLTDAAAAAKAKPMTTTDNAALQHAISHWDALLAVVASRRVAGDEAMISEQRTALTKARAALAEGAK